MLQGKYSAGFCLVFALLVAAAWPAHVATENYQPFEYCPVCSVVCSPELNSDCGIDLLEPPSGFILLEPGAVLLSFCVPFSASFSGRAPPSA
jgi:hypothetical protein